MTRMINADDMIKSLMDRALYDDEGYPILDYEEKMSSVKSFVDSFPTVDAEPVRHGKWLEMIEVNELGEPYQSGVYCSECGHTDSYEPNYCPNCGSRMDAERKEE